MRSLVLAIGVVLLLSSAAWAKPRVALAPFEGDSGGAVSDMVAELLEGDYTVSGPSQVQRKIDELGYGDNLSDKQLKKLANELEAEAIVRGDLATKGKHKVLHVRLFVKGKRVKGFKVEFGSTRSQKVKDALKEKLLEKLGGDSGGGGGGEDEKPAKVEETDTPAETDEKPEKPEKPEKKKPVEQETDEEGDEPPGGKKKTATAEEDEEEIDETVVPLTKKSELHSANRAAVRVDFGPSASSRQLLFTSRNFEQAPKPYKNAVVPGGRVAGELYPLAFGNPNGIVAGLGLGGHFDQTIGLKLRSTAQLGTQFPVDQKHWSVGARFRVAFGTKPTSPTVTLRGGIFHRKFTVDRTALEMGNVIDLPDVLYQGYDPGVDIRFPIIRPIALVLGGEAYLVTNTGSIQKLNQYGQARVTGGEGYAGLDISIGSRLAVRALVEASQVGFAFTGNGELSNNRDGDPSTPDVGGAADRVIGGSLTVGVLY
ncbi:MAG TPA: hypothetical protein VMZ53_14190 [Kofleriaceae bacterium]|nr:hypothetical protein [Kofleriaceae bacterium]